MTEPITREWLETFCDKSFVCDDNSLNLGPDIWGVHIKDEGESWTVFYPMSKDAFGPKCDRIRWIRGHVTREDVIKLWEVAHDRAFVHPGFVLITPREKLAIEEARQAFVEPANHGCNDAVRLMLTLDGLLERVDLI